MADDPSVLAGTVSARFALEQSEVALMDVIEAFQIIAKRMKDSEDEISLAELQRAKTAMAQVRNQLVDEVKNHEKRVLQSEGLVADAPLDFDTIRASIGRKLDSIRDAGDAE